MKITVISIIVIVIVVLLAQVYSTMSTEKTEQHKYQVLKTYDNFEVRKYEPAANLASLLCLIKLAISIAAFATS